MIPARTIITALTDIDKAKTGYILPRGAAILPVVAA